MIYKPRASRNKKPRGKIPMIAWHITAAVVALLVAATLPSDPKVKHVAMIIFVGMFVGGLATFALAGGLRLLVRHRHGKLLAVANWAIQIGFMILAAGLIALFYSVLLKQV